MHRANFRFGTLAALRHNAHAGDFKAKGLTATVAERAQANGVDGELGWQLEAQGVGLRRRRLADPFRWRDPL